jgi:hypothetical protein
VPLEEFSRLVANADCDFLPRLRFGGRSQALFSSAKVILSNDDSRGPPTRDASYVVFAQASEARVDIGGWDAHATRFFDTRIGLAAGVLPALSLVVAPASEPPGIRFVYAHPRDADDVALADAADTAGAGLALLARRCSLVWLVAREVGGASPPLPAVRPHPVDDRLALRLAAILASVFLGPILDVRVPELLGVKSARGRLDRS